MWTSWRTSACSPSQHCSQDLRDCSRKRRAEHPWQKGGPLSLVQMGSVVHNKKVQDTGPGVLGHGKGEEADPDPAK